MATVKRTIRSLVTTTYNIGCGVQGGLLTQTTYGDVVLGSEVQQPTRPNQTASDPDHPVDLVRDCIGPRRRQFASR
jgi:hypothetical protein